MMVSNPRDAAPSREGHAPSFHGTHSKRPSRPGACTCVSCRCASLQEAKAAFWRPATATTRAQGLGAWPRAPGAAWTGRGRRCGAGRAPGCHATGGSCTSCPPANGGLRVNRGLRLLCVVVPQEWACLRAATRTRSCVGCRDVKTCPGGLHVCMPPCWPGGARRYQRLFYLCVLAALVSGWVLPFHAAFMGGLFRWAGCNVHGTSWHLAGPLQTRPLLQTRPGSGMDHWCARGRQC